MKLLRAKIDSRQLNKMLNNSVSYSYGFLDGADMGQIEFNQKLADFTVIALSRYIDSMARANPEILHHVYEWNQVGNENARLYSIQPKASKRVITFNGKFLKSKSVNEGSDTPFYNKAEIMENGIAITISPKNSDVLVFEDEGETIFTTESIYIAHPGGDEVAGSFGRTVETFFNSFFKNAVLDQFMKDLSKTTEYYQGFRNGVTGGGKAAGIRMGHKYMKSAGVEIQ